jgi:hypothetical protein
MATDNDRKKPGTKPDITPFSAGFVMASVTDETGVLTLNYHL